MISKDIVKLNNKKREELNKENLKYYEDMLVYIRVNANISEQQTEEVLLELLEHLLQAQIEGRTAKDVFGIDLKAYCQDLIGEIPKEKKSNQISFFVYIAMQFLAIFSLINGVLGFGLYYFFDLGSATTSFSMGSAIVIVIIYLLLGFLYIFFLLKWLRNSAFKQKETKKWIQFIQLWLFSSVAILLFIFIPRIIPDLGIMMDIPTLSFAGIGIVLYLISFLLNRRLRITK